ncbi:CARDB domain-containing protein [Halopiger djelfimassiliensis]|uniref:CARDB domain-containing protein n=1 Tax=Halopiger djelfimassiliensis TaxID=1293047 RepID=UPI000677BFB0|nr:CARDB domain-containing protein [Halopiger djelfimassiliensis]
MPSLRIRLLTIAVCLFALAVPTAAVTIGEEAERDDVVIEPTSERYASVDADGQLRLDLDALNDRAVTAADDVFTITVTDDAVAAVWIDHGDDGVTFYERGAPDDEITDTTPLEPDAGETIPVGVAVDTHAVADTAETFTVHVEYGTGDGDPERPSEPGQRTGGAGPGVSITQTGIDVSRQPIDAGENVTVNATYENAGTATGRTTAVLTVDGVVVDQRTITLEPGETRTVSFERPMQWPGTYAVGVGEFSESVVVDGPPVELVEATVADAELVVGESTTVTATVANPTDESVERTLELVLDGIVVDEMTVVVPPNEEATVSFPWTADGPGTYDVAVGGVSAGSITVTESSPFPIRNRELAASTTAALAPPTALGLLVLLGAANRRWTR